jgi:hypothetical protein
MGTIQALFANIRERKNIVDENSHRLEAGFTAFICEPCFVNPASSLCEFSSTI